MMVNPTTGDIIRLDSSVQMQVAEKRRKDGTTYRVLRDLK